MVDLFQTGAYLRVPGGNLERPELHSPVIKWAALNIGGDVGRDPTVWKKQREVYGFAGIRYFPWLHCRSLADVEFLIATAAEWMQHGGAKVIGLNVENVKDDQLDLQAVAGLVLDFWMNPHGGQVHMPTLPWVQNARGWQYLHFAVAALEIMADEQPTTFPSGKPDPVTIDQCIEHAFNEGLTKVTLMLKTKNFARTDYGDRFNICHSLYTADDIPVSAAAWNGWELGGVCVRPKPPGGVPVPEKQWYEKPYLKGTPVGPAKLPRSLYPLDAAPAKTPSRDGPDILAWKRAMKRGQRWALSKTFAQLDDTYNNGFAHGTSSNVKDSGIAGFQRQEGIADTGWIGDATYQVARRALVPIGPNKGKPLFDAEAVKLLNQAAKIDWSAPALQLPDLGPVVVGGKSVLDHDLTHPTSEIPLYPAFDDAFTEGREIIAPEDIEVTVNPRTGAHFSSANPGEAFYARGASKIRYWFGHLDRNHPPGASFKKGAFLGKVAPNAIGGGPHAHVGVNVEDLLGKGVELEHRTDYTHGAPTIGEQLGQ